MTRAGEDAQRGAGSSLSRRTAVPGQAAQLVTRGLDLAKGVRRAEAFDLATAPSPGGMVFLWLR